MDKAPVPLQQLRTTVRDRRSGPWTRPNRRPRRDPALELGTAIRNRVRKIGPVHKSSNPKGGDRRKFDDVATYRLWVMGDDYPWPVVHDLILQIYQDKQNRWCLQDYLWAKEPTRSQFVIARPYLMRIWKELSVVNN